MYSYLFSYFVKSTGRVFSFEPNPYVCKILRKRLKGRNVEIYQRAVLDKSNKKVNLCIQPYTLAETSQVEADSIIGSEADDMKRRKPVTNALKKIETLTFCLDDLMEKSPEPIKLIKIDVEGVELSVLKGGQRLIERDQPVIFFEYTRAANSPTVGTIPFLEQINYKCFDSQTMAPMEETLEETLLTDVIAIPRNKLDRYQSLLDNLKELL